MSLPNPTPPSAGQFAHGPGLGVICMGTELPLWSLCSLPESVARPRSVPFCPDWRTGGDRIECN
jgi:hypothetical protein